VLLQHHQQQLALLKRQRQQQHQQQKHQQEQPQIREEGEVLGQDGAPLARVLKRPTTAKGYILTKKGALLSEVRRPPVLS